MRPHLSYVRLEFATGEMQSSLRNRFSATDSRNYTAVQVAELQALRSSEIGSKSNGVTSLFLEWEGDPGLRERKSGVNLSERIK